MTKMHKHTKTIENFISFLRAGFPQEYLSATSTGNVIINSDQ